VYKPPIVIGVHGIRTHAQWQRILAETLSKHGIYCKSFNFGRYGLHRFLWKRANERLVDEFYEFYSDTVSREPGIDLSDPAKRPSAIAHSLGSYIVGRAMLKYPDIVFDKVIFCGCILPRSFDLSALFRRGQAGRVRNEYGSKDRWAGLTGKFVAYTGDSGKFGFDIQSRLLDEERFDHYTHSDFFRGDHIQKYWLPFLLRPPLTLTTAHGRNFSDDDFQSMLRDCLKMDQDCFGTTPHFAEIRVGAGLAARWANIEPDIYTFLIDRLTGKAVGYINAMPVDDEVFKRIKKEGLDPNDILPSYIHPFESRSTCNIYLVSIATDPAIRKRMRGLLAEPFELLFNALVDKLVYYAVRNRVRVNEICATAWTDEGHALCEMAHMKEVGHDQFGNPNYHLSLHSGTPIAPRLIHGVRTLLNAYASLDP
jgi:hypothetical protein